MCWSIWQFFGILQLKFENKWSKYCVKNWLKGSVVGKVLQETSGKPAMQEQAVQ